MAWEAPPLFTTGQIVTAANLNRLSDDLNALVAVDNRVPASATATATTYGAPATGGAGPVVTLTVGSLGEVEITLSATLAHNTLGGFGFMGVAVSGSTTRAADDQHALFHEAAAAADNQIGASYTCKLTGLTAGSNTFTCHYRTTVGTATFVNRELNVRAI